MTRGIEINVMEVYSEMKNLQTDTYEPLVHQFHDCIMFTYHWLSFRMAYELLISSDTGC